MTVSVYNTEHNLSSNSLDSFHKVEVTHIELIFAKISYYLLLVAPCHFSQITCTEYIPNFLLPFDKKNTCFFIKFSYIKCIVCKQQMWLAPEVTCAKV